MKSANRLLAAALLVGLALRLSLLLVPTAPFATKATEPTGDSPEYVRLAANLARAHAFSQDSSPPYRPDVLRTPVYPLFLALPLALFGSSLVWPVLLQLVLLQLLLALAAIWLIHRLALELGLGPAPSALAALLVGLSPNLVFYSVKLTTEMLFVCLLLATLLLVNRFRVIQRWHELVAAGAGCGLLILTRPIAIFFPILLALYVFSKTAVSPPVIPNAVRNPARDETPPRRRGDTVAGDTSATRSSRRSVDVSPPRDRPSFSATGGTVPRSSPAFHGNWQLGIRNCLLLLAAAAFVLAPWVIRNARVSGRYFISTAFDYNICEYTGALTMAADRLIPVDAARDSLAGEAEQQSGPLDTNDQARYWAAMARAGWREVMARPLLAAKIHAAGSIGSLVMPVSIRALRVFSGANLQDDAAVGDPHVAQRTIQLVARGRLEQALAVAWKERLSKMPGPALAILTYAILFHATLLVAFVVGLFLKRSRRLLWLLLPILYFLVSTGPVGEARFRVPIEPLLCLFAAVTLVRPPVKARPA